ncbi:DUF2029 domain-containing protein [Planctomycetales bacterium ZRK34]|nr:DUF2029 domain-containing protein [Planctomycetales bacterium ZRK34]
MDSASQQTRWVLKPWQRWLVIAALVVFAGEFIWCGPMRALDGGYDLSMIYSASMAWRTTGNPYDSELVHQLLVANVHPTRVATDVPLEPSLYPPTTYMLMSPLTWLNWPTARAVWMLINVAMAGGLLMLLGRLAGLSTRGDRMMMLTAAILAMAPLHTGMGVGQISLAGFTFVAAAELLSRRGRPIFAGIALALGIGLKFQIAGPYVVWMLARGRWRTATTAAVTTLGLLIIAGGRSTIAHADWLAAWTNHITAFTSAGAGGDIHGPNASQMIDLSYPLGLLLENRQIVGLIAKAVVSAVMAALLIGMFKNTDRRRELAGFAAFSALLLLPIYHRFYDAVMLGPAIAWAIVHLTTGAGSTDDASAPAPRRRWVGYIVVAAWVLMLAPGAAILRFLVEQGHIDPAIATATWWNLLVMSHMVWAVVAVATATTLGACRCSQTNNNTMRQQASNRLN